MKYKVLITDIAKEDIKEKKAQTVNNKAVRAFFDKNVIGSVML